MATMNVSLPDELKTYVDAFVGESGYGSSSEYMRDLIRQDRARRELRAALLKGAASPVVATADEAYFTSLRASIAAE